MIVHRRSSPYYIRLAPLVPPLLACVIMLRTLLIFATARTGRRLLSISLSLSLSLSPQFKVRTYSATLVLTSKQRGACVASPGGCQCAYTMTTHPQSDTADVGSPFQSVLCRHQNIVFCKSATDAIDTTRSPSSSITTELHRLAMCYLRIALENPEPNVLVQFVSAALG